MPFTITKQDITNMQVDAIVNAANTALQMGGGVCGAIFRAAGAADLQAACNILAPIQTGTAVITPGFKLLAKHIIHTAGPIYRDGRHGEPEQLRSCYMSSLQCAFENKCRSIAFPLISSGIYGYPRGSALQVAATAIGSFLAEQDLDIYLAVYDEETFDICQKTLVALPALNIPNMLTAVDEQLLKETGMNIIFTDGNDGRFVALCKELDEYLNFIVGGEKQRSQYTPLNTLENIHDVALVIEDGQAVACGSFKAYAPNTAEVKRVFTKVDFRNRGYSKGILAALEARALTRGFTKMILETGAPLKEAYRLYRQLGFYTIPNYGQYANMPESICMEKILAGRQ